MSLGRRGDTNNKHTFSYGTPHFFKIILEETLQEKKLRIPQKFVRKFGETLSNLVSIKLPCGSKWNMKLKDYDGQLWLDKGWPEFAKHYSIGRGHMLIFSYDGKSEFHVVIFDKSTVEIDYPSIPLHFDEPNIDGKLRAPKRRVVDHDFVDILDGFLPCHKTTAKSSLQCSQPPKRIKTSPTTKTRSKSSRPKDKDYEHNPSVVKNSMSKGNTKNSKPGKPDLLSKSERDRSSAARQTKIEVLRCMKTLDRSEKFAALQRTSGFKSERPFFKVVIQPYYVRGKRLAFPPNFAKKHLKSKSDNVTFKLPNGKKTWPVKYTFGVQKKAAPRFRCGWTRFARDNNLTVGDVCVFVLLKAIKVSFEVVIFRVRGSPKGPTSPAHDETRTPSFRGSSVVRVVDDSKCQRSQAGDFAKGATIQREMI